MAFHGLIAHFFLAPNSNIPLSGRTSLFILFLLLFAVLIATLHFVNVPDLKEHSWVDSRDSSNKM